MMSNQAISIHFPGKLVFGKGKLLQVVEEVALLKVKRAIIVTIEPLLPQLKGIIEQLKKNSVEVAVDTSIIQEPYFSDFEKLVKKIEPFNPELVIGIGGGSVLDVAKLVAAQIGNQQTLSEYVGIGLLKARNTKLICLPATAGTGSEVSPNAILVDDADGQKKGIISPHLVPDIVILDPLLTISVPPSITAATGIDALTHCLEAYTNKFAHPMIDLYAYEGMKYISSSLAKAVQDGKNENARTNVAMGSMYGGICLGPVNTAAVHALSYPLGSMFHLPHGLSNALLLPYVMEYNLESCPDRYADVARAIGCVGNGDAVVTARKGVQRIKELIKECGLPLQLHEVNVTKDSIPVMAEAALKIQRLLKNNPREVNLDDAINIYNAAF